MQIISHPNNNFSTQANIVSQVADHLGDDYQPTHIILDGTDYSTESTLLDESRDVAFSWTRDRPTDHTPPHIRQIMQREDCANLVWFSRKAMGYDKVLFTWVIAHELRHVNQSKHGFPRADIRSVIRELRRRQEFIRLPPHVFAPEEIDSDVCGLRVAKALYGTEYVWGFLSAHPLPRCPYPAYQKFLECVALKCFNKPGIDNEGV